MFIQLTNIRSDRKIRINVNMIISYYNEEDEDGTRVWLGSNIRTSLSFDVKETPEEIDTMIENSINSAHDKEIEVLEIRRNIMLNERGGYEN